MTEPAKKTAAKRTNRRAPAVPESVEAQANEALAEAFRNNPPTPGPANMLEARSVHQLWIDVMRSVRSIAKGDFNPDQNFKFRGVDAVVDKVGAALREVGVHIRPRRILEHTATEYQSKRGARMVNRVVRVEWEVTGPQGDSFLGESMGEAADMSDKSMSKAQSVAYRVYLLQALNIPTGEPDPDSEVHERGSAAAGEGYYWDQQQEQQHTRQRPTQDQQRQAQAGEENQDAQPSNEEARKEMWRVAKGLGWKWDALVARFRSDYTMETSQAAPEVLKAFTMILVGEAEAEEDKAKAAAAEVLGAKEVQPDEAQGIL